MRNIPWYVYVLGVLLVIGAIRGEEQPQPVVTPEPTTIVTPTVAQACYKGYYDLVVDTMDKLPQANTLEAVDALIYRYDTTMKLPYECGSGELLDKIDMSVRLALAESRTALMSKTPMTHAVNSVIHQQEAIKTLNEWKNE